MLVTFVVLSGVKSRLVKPEQPQNIEFIFVTFAVLSGVKSRLVRPEQPLNIGPIFVTFAVSSIEKSIFVRLVLLKNILPLFFAACTFIPLICVETFITVPPFSVQATTPPSPSASTSIVAADAGFVSLVKIIFVTVSGINALNSLLFLTPYLYPLTSNVFVFIHKSISPLSAICIAPSSLTSTLFVNALSVNHETASAENPAGILNAPSTICPLLLCTTSFTSLPSSNTSPASLFP